MGASTLILVLLAAAVAPAGPARSPSIRVSHGIDARLCPFPLEITVKTRDQPDQVSVTARRFRFTGPSTITLRNSSTGRVATLGSPGSYALDTTNGNVTFRGRHVWFWSTGNRVPFLSTDGAGSLKAPYFVLAAARTRARVIDPCALVAAAPPPTQPARTRAPWGLPAFALSQMAYAGLLPEVGNLLRHGHVHLDVLVDGKKVTVPAGVGFAGPVDHGRAGCPRTPGTRPSGDCRTGHFFTARVANAPIHTHSTSGIIHVESDRLVRFTLGQFFDLWGVRLSASCVGGYCTGGGKELRVFVDGRRVSGDPRSIVLTNRQALAVVFGAPGEFGSVPSTYEGGWPGRGCGGTGEPSCLP